MTQRDAFNLLKMGHNVYLTGAAGSGKTYLLNQYIAYLKQHKIPVGITASTGIAATHMNGKTIHSWSGIGIKDTLNENDIRDLLRKSYLKTITKTKVLIIDEISMLHAHRLDLIDQICRAFKSQPFLPFGGIQVILCGDFFQLPPVSKKGEDNSFVHTSQAWNTMELRVCYLDEQHRQGDKVFLQMLKQIRDNHVTRDTREILESRLNQEVEMDLPPTKLFTHNIDVDSINNRQLDKINTKPSSYPMSSTGNPNLLELLKKSCLAPEKLQLKKDAVVMFVKNNFAKGYVNGTLGKIIGFDNDNFPIVETADKRRIVATPENWKIEENDKTLAQINQIPLRLAWAITVHKSQGMSLDGAEIDLSKAFEPGMGYVALSRVRTLNGIKLLGINDVAYEVNREALDLDRSLLQQSLKADEYLQALGETQISELQAKFMQKIHTQELDDTDLAD